MSSMFSTGINQIRTSIYRGTALLKKYSDKFLLNTIEKLKSEMDQKLNRLMDLEPNILVVLADGVRFRCERSSNFDYGHFSFSMKDLFNSFNCIGFVTGKNGRFIGFYPECGVGSNGSHYDSHVTDFVLFNNVDNILSWLIRNSKPWVFDGTRVIFDRALARGSRTRQTGVINWATPFLTSHRKGNPMELNEGRQSATSTRWRVEAAFGLLG